MTQELPEQTHHARHDKAPLPVRRKAKPSPHLRDSTSGTPASTGETLGRASGGPSTESLLLDFLDHMNALESGLAQRWRDSSGRPDVAMSE
ncbi:hypothetical protein JQK87_14345 [Streptomyces sp. G44]|uniref:hypothetical protein n=1 Tax=Streptomyces sp. G44 TaxID=2807632 RepID=UPI001960E54B|nr:hypothetical protein [Streptomyces sp. G44]MBM7169573.1 hypothetical protein [Streptomyces sp. G44]